MSPEEKLATIHYEVQRRRKENQRRLDEIRNVETETIEFTAIKLFNQKEISKMRGRIEAYDTLLRFIDSLD